MNIAFRTDASIQIGTGHVMRCLTLATELQQRGHDCRFICREHPGHLADFIAGKGFAVDLLPPSAPDTDTSVLSWNDHAPWLGVSWQQDAIQTKNLLKDRPIDWLIVDHYALDAGWEQQLSAATRQIMVIDDLADRAHQCDLLLDQTYGRSTEDYQSLTPNHCELLCGSQFALLRPEFAQWRMYSLQRRQQPKLKELLVNMGGVDKDNITGQVLDALYKSELPLDCRIIVVMGTTAPWLKQVKQQAETMPWHTEVKVGVSNMAQLMTESDLAIGAAGATSWERCCLGLPTIMVVLARNQHTIAEMLQQAGAAAVAPVIPQLAPSLNHLLTSPTSLLQMSNLAAEISDGQGCLQVCHFLEKSGATPA